MPAISIIVPVYNVEAYLPQCIDSIRRQSFRDIEIICIVDGSTDRSEDILRLYEQVEPRLRIIVKENSGLCAARNTGIEAATGTYVMFVDADDMLTANACQTVYELFQRATTEVVTFGAWCYPRFASTPWYESKFTPNDVHFETFSPDILFKEESHPFVWRTAVALDLLKRTGLRFDESITSGEDRVFHFALYPKANGVTLSSKRLNECRLNRAGSLMATSFTSQVARLNDHISICERICENWEADHLMESCGSELAAWMGDFLLPYCLRMPDADRAILVPRLRDLFDSHFSPASIDGMDENDAFKPVCKALVDPQWDGDLPASVRLNLLNTLNANSKRNGGKAETAEKRTASQSKQRATLPLSTAGLEWQLDNLGHRIEDLHWEQAARETKEHTRDTERILWTIEESQACTRALELLRCELLAKGISA